MKCADHFVTSCNIKLGTLFQSRAPNDLAHGGVQGEAQDMDEEVDGVPGFVPSWPAPITVFDNQTWKSGQNEIACGFFDELKSALLEQWQQQGVPGGADLLTRLPRLWGEGCHSLYANEGWMRTRLTCLRSTMRV